MAPDERMSAQLEHMEFDDLLSWLRLVGHVEGFTPVALTAAAAAAPLGCGTRVELHVGASAAGDVHEGELLVAAIEARAAARC